MKPPAPSYAWGWSVLGVLLAPVVFVILALLADVLLLRLTNLAEADLGAFTVLVMVATSGQALLAVIAALNARAAQRKARPKLFLVLRAFSIASAIVIVILFALWFYLAF